MKKQPTRDEKSNILKVIDSEKWKGNTYVIIPCLSSIGIQEKHLKALKIFLGTLY